MRMENRVQIFSPVCEGDKYFAILGSYLDNFESLFRFEVNKKVYQSLKVIRDIRCFDTMPGLEYFHYFHPGFRNKDIESGVIDIGVNVVQGKDNKIVFSTVPIMLAENLMWFWEMKDISLISHLRLDATCYKSLSVI